MNKEFIVIAILITIALCINIKITNDIKWQREADAEWEKMLDPEYQPKYIAKVIRACKEINYVIAQEKYYKD